MNDQPGESSSTFPASGGFTRLTAMGGIFDRRVLGCKIMIRSAIYSRYDMPYMIFLHQLAGVSSTDRYPC